MSQTIYIFLIFIGVFIITGCKKDNDTYINQPPVADAGADQVILLPADSIELKGSGTDPDGSIESFRWSKVVGPVSFDILNPNEAVTKVKNLTEGVYEIVLIITDNDGASSKDFITITVLPSNVPVNNLNYRSKQTGTWSDSSSWEQYNGTHWINATKPPNNMDGEISILDRHTITIETPVEINDVIINEGGRLLVKSDLYLSDQLAAIDDLLINNGILEWQDGLLGLIGGYSMVTLVNNGHFIISGDNNTWSYWWDSQTKIINNGIITKISTGHSNLDWIHVISNTSTGIIQGIGVIAANEVYNYGTIDPGLPIGVLNLNVKKPFSAGSTLYIEIKDNSGPGTGHDQLQFDTDITLSGTLTIKEIGTSVSNGKFAILTSGGKINGKFKKMNLPPGYSLQINNNSVDLVKN